MHGQTAFRQWFYDAPGSNLRADMSLGLKRDDAGYWSFDNLKSEVPFLPSENNMLFAMDDGGPNATALGNQGQVHNDAFTVTLRASFTCQVDDTLKLRGEDDIFVCIDQKLVTNLGDIHGTETAEAQLDIFGLTQGKTCPSVEPLFQDELPSAPRAARTVEAAANPT